MQPARADEEAPGEDNAHDYPDTEDKERVKLPEQVPVKRLQAPDEIADEQRDKRFFRAGQGSFTLLDKTYGGAGFGPDANVGSADAELQRCAVF